MSFEALMEAGLRPEPETPSLPELSRPRSPGRPIKLTSERIGRIALTLKAGNYLETAFQVGGISKASGYAYLAEGRDVQAGLEAADDPDAFSAQLSERQRLCLEFLEEVTRATVEAEALMVAHVSIAAKGDWRAGIALLERRHPERWSRQEGRVLRGSLEASVEVHVSVADAARRMAMDPEARKLACDLLAKVVPAHVIGLDADLAAEDDDDVVDAELVDA